jgi:transcriptional regulator with XRE-family HTH domain
MDKLPSLSELGQLVRRKRKQEKLSQKALADLVGVSHVTVLALEKGTGKARLENAWKILTGLGLAEQASPVAQRKEVAERSPS